MKIISIAIEVAVPDASNLEDIKDILQHVITNSDEQSTSIDKANHYLDVVHNNHYAELWSELSEDELLDNKPKRIIGSYSITNK